MKTPGLGGLLALNLASTAASSMVIVNTVVIVRSVLGLGAREVALTLATYGGGSMRAALLVPRLLDKVSDRTMMVAAASDLTIGRAQREKSDRYRRSSSRGRDAARSPHFDGIGHTGFARFRRRIGQRIISKKVPARPSVSPPSAKTNNHHVLKFSWLVQSMIWRPQKKS